MRASPEKLERLAAELGERLHLLLRPSVAAEIILHSKPPLILFFRRSMLDANSDGPWRCLACDNLGISELRFMIDAQNPISPLEEPVAVRMLCCRSPSCKDRVDAVANQVCFDDKFREALDALESRVS